MKSKIIDAVMSLAAEHPVLAVFVVGGVLVVVVPPVVKLVREYWAPKVHLLRQKFGRMLLGPEDNAAPETIPADPALDVRRLRERERV